MDNRPHTIGVWEGDLALCPRSVVWFWDRRGAVTPRGVPLFLGETSNQQLALVGVVYKTMSLTYILGVCGGLPLEGGVIPERVAYVLSEVKWSGVEGPEGREN